MKSWGVDMKRELLKNKKIIAFIESVEKMLYIEENSSDIKSELLDHIECLVSDYMDSGFDLDTSISKSLYDMGDPKEIGYSFADFDYMKKRKYIRLALKYSSILLIVLLLIFDYTEKIRNGSDNILLIINIINIFFAYSSKNFIYHKVKMLDLNTSPNLILWSSKKRFPWEYFILGMFFAPIILMFIGLYFMDEGINLVSILNMWPLAIIFYSTWAFFYSEKFRIPKYIVSENGLIVKGVLISWIYIKSYSWSSDYMSKDNKDYSLDLKLFNNKDNKKVSIYYLNKRLYVNRKQKNYMDQILRERI
ncbi:hypothetical protein [Helicovermis profundi]